jgi:uncharacterized membrane protein
MFNKLKISKRHLAKSLTWRFIGSIDTLVFAWLVTGSIKEGLNVSLITTFTKLIWYYIHEQVWFKSSLADSNKRHIIKTFSWRFFGTIDTVVFAWLIIGNPLIGLKIGLFETVSKMLLYFGHEKLWYRINYGLDLRNKRKRLKIHQEERSEINK